MADDEFRVEAKETLVGRGSGTTPERIAEIQERAAQLERLGRKPPVRSFADVLAAGSTTEDEATQEEATEAAEPALPKRGPRPALLHPRQRDAFGRHPDADDDVILKG